MILYLPRTLLLCKKVPISTTGCYAHIHFYPFHSIIANSSIGAPNVPVTIHYIQFIDTIGGTAAYSHAHCSANALSKLTNHFPSHSPSYFSFSVASPQGFTAAQSPPHQHLHLRAVPPLVTHPHDTRISLSFLIFHFHCNLLFSTQGLPALRSRSPQLFLHFSVHFAHAALH